MSSSGRISSSSDLDVPVKANAEIFGNSSTSIPIQIWSPKILSTTIFTEEKRRIFHKLLIAKLKSSPGTVSGKPGVKPVLTIKLLRSIFGDLTPLISVAAMVYFFGLP